jgi:hypothetical protein
LSLTRAKSVPNCQLIFVLVLIAFGLPGVDLQLQGFDIRDPATQTLRGKNGELTFGHIEPTAVLGCVVKLQFACEAARFGGHKCFVERGGCMRIEIIHH